MLLLVYRQPVIRLLACGAIKAGCNDGDPCTVDTCGPAGVCVFKAKCPATTDACNPISCNKVTGACVTSPLACPPDKGCLKSDCDSVKGCVSSYNQSICQSTDPCTLGTCLTSGNCSYTKRNCLLEVPSNIVLSACLNYTCVPYVGCQVDPFDCRKNITIKNGSCQVLQCNNQTNKCETKGDKCFLLAALVGGLAGGAIAGIVAAGVVAAATIGGGTYAATTLTAAEEDAITQPNPLYQGNTLSGTSPVFLDAAS